MEGVIKMENITAIIIVGVYTIIYVNVFFIQNSQIKKMKEINSSMKSYMDIIDIDEIRRFVELKDESTWLEFSKILADDSRVKEMVEEIYSKKQVEMTEAFEKEMGKDYVELVNFAVKVLKYVPINKREEMIDNRLPNTKRLIVRILKKERNNEFNTDKFKKEGEK